jgi:hypothetical protein
LDQYKASPEEWTCTRAESHDWMRSSEIYSRN